ncbi:nuclease-related domain-containing DEAD/DEAH box helicase [Pilimelia anulata]|uniref:nuclease-related domain-containing DEAD/DEAH box helicase n=1 Tax=Pilimelia anulata TaxID=53371 RepID=UPI001E4117B7|nr:UvrD-helicase domain-containing protein [Pilimelia anulata]
MERSQRFAAGAEGERKVAAALLSLTEDELWRALVDRRWPGHEAANVDVIMVGPSGVFVIDAKMWAHQPLVVAGRLQAGGQDRHDQVDKLLAATVMVEDALKELGTAPLAVTPMMVFAGRKMNAVAGRVLLRDTSNVLEVLAAPRQRLKPKLVAIIAAELEAVFVEHEAPDLPAGALDSAPEGSTGATAGAGEAMAGNAEALELFDPHEVVRAQMAAALAGPIENWMTFLHQDQRALVARNFSGPARIGGAAGTGKTVVGLHRAVHLAQQTTGKILFITYVKNLPLVQANLLAQMAPRMVDRIEFTSLHRWALKLLNQRTRRRVTLDDDKARHCFEQAWMRVGRDSGLKDLEPNLWYWYDEIRCVIKGRGIASLPQYLALNRRGRGQMLRLYQAHREAVWTLCEQYNALLAEQDLVDFDDVLINALELVQDDPPEYAAVIADEVQDFTLVAVKLLHALTGDAPNGLLLIGDGQQSVYPGGFRLADAGITVRGAQSSLLRVNYRNAAQIFTAAMQVLEGTPLEDIDGVEINQPDVESTYHDGQVIHMPCASAVEHDQQLLERIADLRSELGDEALAQAAVLCRTHAEVNRYLTQLTDAGHPCMDLEKYDGTPAEGVKIGTVLRAKGLEFKYVYLPHHDEEQRQAEKTAAVNPDRLITAKTRLFVGMTRARDRLWLGSVRTTAPSVPTQRIPLKQMMNGMSQNEVSQSNR